MNREILFRGKKPVEYYNTIDNSGGKWVEGYLIALHDGQSPAIQSEIKIVPDYVGARIDSKIFCVIPETVSQFTGLYDKNGARIYENDIVYYDGSCYKVVFENRNGTGYFGIVVGENETWGFGNSTPAYMMAVVGNIYDNPDLLEVSKE